MIIETASASDVDVICALGRDVGEFEVSAETVGFWPAEVVAEAIESPEAVVVVARDGDSVVGFAMANLNQAFRKAIIENIYVVPAQRGSGVGRQLLERVCSIATIDRGCEYVAALVPTDAEAALATYLGAGFAQGKAFVWLDKSFAKEFRR